MKILLIIFLIIISYQLKAVEPFWDKLNGPNIGQINSMVEIKEKTYLAAANGIYKTTDEGKNWFQVYNGNYFRKIICSKKGVIAALAGKWFQFDDCFYKVIISKDEGKTWKEIFSSRGEYAVCIRDINFNTEEELYIVEFINNSPVMNDSNYIIHHTKDYGNTYFKTLIPLMDTSRYKSSGILSLDISKNNYIYINYINYTKKNKTAEAKLCVSKDNGKSWSQLTNFGYVNNSVFPNDDKTVYISYDIIPGWWEAHLAKSDDSCKTWNTFDVPFSIDKFAVDSNFIYALEIGPHTDYNHYNTFYSSSDFGETWEKTTLDQEYFYTDLFLDSKKNLFLMTRNGLIHYNTKTKEYSIRSKGYTFCESTNMAFTKDGTIFSTSIDGVHKSTDDGLNWSSCGLDTVRLTTIFITKNDNIYISSAGTIINQSGEERAFYRSSNKGKTWELKKNWCIQDLVELDNGELWAGTIKSTDNGETWINNEKLLTIPLLMKKNRLGEIFVVFYKLGLYKTKDNGKTFIKLSDSLPKKLEFHPYKDFCISDLGFSTDNGETWSDQYRIFDYGTYDSLYNFINLSYFRDYYLEYCSNNFTKTKDIRNGLDTICLRYEIKTAPNGYIYIMTEGAGIFRSRQKYVSVKEEEVNYKNYLISPNPASEYIEIKNVISNEMRNPVVEIFNIIGEKISTSSSLRDATHQEGNFKIDISTLPAGVYFIKIGDKFEKFVKL